MERINIYDTIRLAIHWRKEVGGEEGGIYTLSYDVRYKVKLPKSRYSCVSSIRAYILHLRPPEETSCPVPTCNQLIGPKSVEPKGIKHLFRDSWLPVNSAKNIGLYF